MQEIERDTKKSRALMLCAMGLVLLLLAVVYFFVRPNVITAKGVNHTGLSKFSFERETPDGWSLKCTMKAEDGGARVMLYDSAMGGKRERVLDASNLSALQAMIESKGIYLLDGFYERGPVLTGTNSFSLTIRYADGKDVAASGVTLLPKSIEENTSDIKSYFYGLFVSN